MRGMRIVAWVLAILGLALGGVLTPVAHAEVRYELVSPTGEAIQLNGVNQKRETDSLVLYTTEYGASTRTNPYGVEVSAVPVSREANRYRVVQVSSIWACQEEPSLSKCGNMTIPPNGVVLSATGEKRNLLQTAFQPGKEFVLNRLLTHENRISVNVVNPSPETNPTGSGFPGYRGGNQLVVYDRNYGQPTTGTNEFGFEVTVKNGRVVEMEGANSVIPQEEGSFVLSGHGRARQWLLEHAPVGAKIVLDNSMAISVVDRDTYLYQLDQMMGKIQALGGNRIPSTVLQRVMHLKQSTLQLSDEQVASQALAIKEVLTPILWASYPSVAQSAPRAIWHRPSEASMKEVRQSLDLIQQAGFNTIFLESYLHGDPIFPSDTLKAYKIPQKLPFKIADAGTEDVLKVWLDEAHKRGMKVHVWFQTFYAGNRQYDKSMGSILQTYPQWANIQKSGLGKDPLPPSTLEAGGYFLDPANQEAQQFLLTLIEEMVTRYPVDGFQLDYIRYPSSFPPDRFSYVATTWGYTPVARELFQNRYGVDPVELNPKEQPELWAEWNDFKTRQVDRFVQKASGLMKIKRPEMPISVAVFPKPEESLQRKHQNWIAWAQNGWVDFIAPMTLTSSTESIALDTKEVKMHTALPVITGVFGPFNGNSPSEVVEQVWAAIQAGAQGVAMFDTAHLTQKMADALRMGIFNLGRPPQSALPTP